MIKENCNTLEKLDVPVNVCDVYLKLRYDCNALVIELHTIGAVCDELLLRTTGMKWKDNSYGENNSVPAKHFFYAIYRLTLFSRHAS